MNDLDRWLTAADGELTTAVSDAVDAQRVLAKIRTRAADLAQRGAIAETLHDVGRTLPVPDAPAAPQILPSQVGSPGDGTSQNHSAGGNAEQPMSSFGAEMRRRRIEMGMSLHGLSVLVHYSKGYLGRVETGVKKPHPDLARLVDAALAADGALVKLVPPIRRRSISGQIARPDARTSTGFSGQPNIDVGGLLDDPRSSDAYERALTSLRTLGRELPAGQLVGQLEQLASTLIHAARASGGTHQARLLGLAARYAEYLGWVLQEAGAGNAAASWIERARQLADAVGDAEMAGNALLRRASLALFEGDSDATVYFALQAQTSAPASDRLRQLAFLREAQGHALAGDATATTRALEQAAAMPDRDREDEELDAPTSLQTTTPWCLVDLGQVRHAASIYDSQSSETSTSARSRARHGVRHALAHALGGEVEQACSITQLILPDVHAVRSATIGVDVARLFHSMAKQYREPAVRELMTQMQGAF